MNRSTILLLLFLSAHSWAACPSHELKETLNCYFAAVDMQDEERIAKVSLEFTRYHFNTLERPKREIHQEVILTKDLVGPMPNGEIPVWAQKGNKEVWVKETYRSWSHMVSFFLKQKQGLWYVVGHSSHNQPK